MGASSHPLELPAAVSDEDVAAVIRLLPEIELVDDASARRRCAHVWVAAWRNGNWPDLTRVPTLSRVPIGEHDNLLAHTRRVARACDDVARHVLVARDHAFDRDGLLEAALLHDVAKTLEYEPTGDSGFRLSEIGRCMPHAAIGAQWALALGASELVGQAIYSHTPKVREVPRSVEGAILYAVDQLDADTSRLGVGELPGIKP